MKPEFPSGFSPTSNGSPHNTASSHNYKSDSSKFQVRFSMIERLEETIKVGLALGLNMDGCETTLASLIVGNGDLKIHQMWGNIHFDFASTSARGLSGGILCVWNGMVFKKSRIICNDNYVVVEGLWIPTGSRLMWIAVYAPQNISSKITLWSSLTNHIANWNGSSLSWAILMKLEWLKKDMLGGYNFTWTNKLGTKMSKLDRFLTSKSFHEDFPHVIGIVLEKGDPDHRPILLKEFKVDYGPTPFRFYHSWQEMKGFRDMVVDAWNHDGIILGDINRLEANDIAQKAKDGAWIEEPFNVKAEFLDHFSKIFQRSHGITPSLDGDMPNCLSPTQSGFLERQISREEIKKAVWDCGGERAPGLDGFTFKFVTTFWDLIEDDVIRFVKEFYHSSYFPKGHNSSFIALIPKISNAKFVSDFRPISLIGCQYKIIGKILANRLSKVIESVISPKQFAFIKGWNILDGPLILNEVLAWTQKHKQNLMVFKVDFKKAFDSLRWDFLKLVMTKLDFSTKWCSWIFGCLRNARSSVLVNGSRTCEFDIQRGLRQGDLLSSFLFILAIEGLHVLTCKAKTMGLFKGASISNGNDSMSISHLMYADDVIFLGIGVSQEEVYDMANTIGCDVATFPLKYLGVPVGLSVRGRLSLIKSVLGNLPSYYMSIYMMHVSIQKKLESMRNNFFIGGDLDEKKITWMKWKILFSEQRAGRSWHRKHIWKIGNRASCRFWEDIWCGNQPLKVQFSRIFQLELEKNCFIADRIGSVDWHDVLEDLQEEVRSC
nr:RNA-directed DNA polymerase, eukaryota, reverse transcriptase zinc-binding domain protein [Tanacetum cinerariifolium]